ncbi:MAG: Clp protease N-terminal domain-containing protein, partial [Pyrinomonadaceae bacterium]
MLTKELEETLSFAVDEAVRLRHEYVTLEHLLYALLDDKTARNILFNCGGKLEEIGNDLEEYFKSLETLPLDIEHMP